VVEQGESVQLIAEPRARVYRLVEENYIANHVKPKDVREASVGIELFQRAERKEVYWAELLDDPPPFTLAQYASVRVLLRGLQERHGLSNGIKLHKEVQPAMPRKECGPGKWRNCGKIDPWRIEDTVELYDDRMESGLILSSALGDIGTCEAPGLPVGAPQDQVQWEACYVTGSCPTSIVTVQDGLVTGIAPGTARIKAQVGGRQGNIIVRVVRPKGPWQMTWTTSENYSSSTSLKLWDYEGWGSETNSSSSGGTALFGENGELLSISTGGSGSTSESHRYYRLCWPYSSGSWWTKLNIDETETQFSFTDNNLRASLNFGVENGKLYVRDPFGWTSFETTGTTKVKLVEWSCNGPQYDTEYETERPYSGKFYGARFGNIMADNETGKSFSSHSEDTYSEPIYWGGAIIGYGTWTETASITIVKTGTGP
jgi:hypothetical protein